MNRVHVAWLAMVATLAATGPAAGQQMEPGTRPATGRHYGRAVSLGHFNGRQRAVGGIKSDVDVPVQDVLKDLSFGAMLAVDVEKGRFGIGFNGLFARVSPDSKVGDIKFDVTSDSGQLAILPFYRCWNGSTAYHPRARRCASSSRPRPAFASPTCAPRSTCTPAGPSMAAKAGSTP